MKVTDGGRETLLSVIRPCRMRVSLSKVLNMNKSPHLIID